MSQLLYFNFSKFFTPPTCYLNKSLFPFDLLGVFGHTTHGFAIEAGGLSCPRLIPFLGSLAHTVMSLEVG